jgi:polysaccharide deacetylase family protein (PEP-CTERM system associated)
MSTRPRAAHVPDLLTVEVEDYYQIGAFERIIPSAHWGRFERRLEQSTLRTLELLQRFDTRATFFVRGSIAATLPDLVREISRQGHEIASEGYHRRAVSKMSPDEFRDDLARARDALETASETRVLGYRFTREWFTPVASSALQILAEQQYAYHSSFVPLFAPSWRPAPPRFAHQRRVGEALLWEFPLSTCRIAGCLIPIAGGNYFRQLPRPLLRRLVDGWHRRHGAPFVMYFHVRELDPEQPQISAASPLERIRHYRNLDKMHEILEDYFRTYRFGTIAAHLALTTEPDPEASRRLRELSSARAPRRPAGGTVVQTASQEPAPAPRVPVTIVVPCFNEQLTIPYLANTLRGMEALLSPKYDMHFVFVDDGSRDGTWQALQGAFGGRDNVTLVQHPRNVGVAGAILTGIRSAKTEIVCSMDCDCSYEPAELGNMIPLLTDDTDMVTGSPYHPSGAVMNVPAWRLALSHSASFLYRRVLSQPLFTYTSCFRVYRRQAVAELVVTEGGFLGVAEMLGRLDLRGSKIVEYPATLHVRVLGKSKMKVLRTIAGHLRLLARLLVLRLRCSGQLTKQIVGGNRPISFGASTIPTPVTKTEKGNP